MIMGMDQFEQEWQDWAAHCVRPGTSATNLETLRCAFYSGAMHYARLVGRITVGHDRADALALIADLHEEMRAYAEALVQQFGGAAALGEQ